LFKVANNVLNNQLLLREDGKKQGRQWQATAKKLAAPAHRGTGSPFHFGASLPVRHWREVRPATKNTMTFSSLSSEATKRPRYQDCLVNMMDAHGASFITPKELIDSP
jgi:hypothetical protein